MNPKIQNAINEQINKELYSAYLYLSMATYAESESFPGIANWFKVQAQEETDHAMKFFDYVNRRGGRVTLDTIEKPATEFKSILELFETTLTHEQSVTLMIHRLYERAVQEKDYAFQSFLKWFIDEQVEEEENAMELVAKVKMLGSDPVHFYHLDQELAGRVFVSDIEKKE